MMETVRCDRCEGHPMAAQNCRKCGGCGFTYKPAAEPVTVPFEAVSDLRLALEETYRDYAKQAIADRRWEEAAIWNRAADIARGFVVSRRVPL
jgi:hypothetical protein